MIEAKAKAQKTTQLDSVAEFGHVKFGFGF
jgi:hypothetical protein